MKDRISEVENILISMFFRDKFSSPGGWDAPIEQESLSTHSGRCPCHPSPAGSTSGTTGTPGFCYAELQLQRP